MKPVWIIAFSGHRNLQRPDLAKAVIQVALSRCKERVEASGGVIHLYLSAAYGADLMAISIARSLGIPVHIILPKPIIYEHDGKVNRNAGFAADFYRDEVFLEDEWRQVESALDEAKRGTMGWTYRITQGSQADPECYYDTGVQMLEAADALVAVWDGAPARGLGGTAEMVEIARSTKVPIVVCDPATGHFNEENIEVLGSADDEGTQRVKELDISSSHSQEIFRELDERANQHSRLFRNATVRSIWLHAIATSIAAIAALLQGGSLASQQILAAVILVEWLVVLFAWWKMKSVRRGNIHDRWLKTRFAVELMRPMLTSIHMFDPLHPAVSRHKKDWRRFAVSAGLAIIKENPPMQSWQNEVSAYIDRRIDSADSGQIPHFSMKQKEAEPIFMQLTKVAKIFSTCSVVFVFAAFLFKGYQALYGTWSGSPFFIPAGLPTLASTIFFKFLPIILPLGAGVAIALRSSKDSGRRTYRYAELADRLLTLRQQLSIARTESSARRVVTVIEEILMDELIEWHLSEKQKGTK